MNNRIRPQILVFICRLRFLQGLLRIDAMKYFLYGYLGEASHPSENYVTHPVWNRGMGRVVKIAP